MLRMGRGNKDGVYMTQRWFQLITAEVGDGVTDFQYAIHSFIYICSFHNNKFLKINLENIKK